MWFVKGFAVEKLLISNLLFLEKNLESSKGKIPDSEAYLSFIFNTFFVVTPLVP